MLTRRGPLIPFLISAAAVAFLATLLVRRSTLERGAGDLAARASGLVLFCAAGLKEPVEAIARAYEKECGIPVHIQYGGSGALLSAIRVVRSGDLFLAADNGYTDLAREQGLVDEIIPLARLRPVIVVPAGNPKGIASAADLGRADVRLALGNPDAAAIGRHSRQVLEAAGLWPAIEEAVRLRGVLKPTVNEVANDVKIGAVDAGIVWDGNARQYPELEALPLREAGGATALVAIGVLVSAARPAAALRFARYVGAPERGLREFESHGYTVVEGDSWAEVPELVYFSGAVNRLAIEETLRAFEEREGVRITTKYNGCGILLGEIKLGERPDIYHTCDRSFMAGVEPLFGDSVPITETPLVILVARGNPLKISCLADCARPGLRLGIANELQSALGALTAELLRGQGLLEAAEKNVVVRAPTADLLVNQLRVGALDAAIVYEANAARVREHLDLVRIELPNATAVQTLAVGKGARYPQLAARLLAAMRSAASRERYRARGFRWIAPVEEP